MLTKANVTRVLRQLQQRDGDGVEPHLVIARRDWRWRTSDLVPCDAGGLPSLQPGTDHCCRVSTPDGRDGLHLAFDRDVVAIHLDRVDARRDPVGHGVDATGMVAGVGIGLLAGLVLAAATGKPLALLGAAAAGGALGALIARRVDRYYLLHVNGRVERLTAATRQQAGALVLAHVC